MVLDLIFVDASQGQHANYCIAREDSDLEAFSRDPTDVRFAVLDGRLTAIPRYLSKVFLSYWPRLLSQ